MDMYNVDNVASWATKRNITHGTRRSANTIWPLELLTPIVYVQGIIRTITICTEVPSGHGWDQPTMLNLNARSLSEEKLDKLQVNVRIHDVSIICVTETRFKYYKDDNNLSIEGFSVERKYRCDGRTGGGVACYIRNSFMYKILSNLEEKELG